MKRFLALLIIFSLFALPCHAAVTGSVSLANIRLSLVNGTAFVDFSAANTLTPYINWKLTLTDSAGKKAVGFIRAAGTGETYGPELVVNGGMETGNPPTGWTPGGTCTFAQDADAAVGTYSGKLTPAGAATVVLTGTAFSLTAGWLMRMTLYKKSAVSNRATSYLIPTSEGAIIGSATSNTSWTKHTGYGTVKTTKNHSPVIYALYGEAGDYAMVDDVSVRQTLSPSPTGVTISSTRGGAVQSWTSIESGFNYNGSSGYTYTLTAPPRGGMFLGMGFCF